jgi:MATE family multidrug resistance protein
LTPAVQDQKAPPTGARHLSPGYLQEILRLAIPAMLAIASDPLFSIADTAMIGRLGVEPLAARAIGAALIGGIYWLFTFLIFGTTTIVGYQHGAHDTEACGQTYLHALLVATLGGVIVAAAGIYFAPNLYRGMGAADKVLREGVPYFRIRVAGAPFIFLFYASVGFFRGVQNTRIPMLIAFLMSGTNLALDYALIYGNLGLPRMGLRGAAIASWTAQLVGAAGCLLVFFFSRVTVSYRPREWRIQWTLLRPLFHIGRDLAARTGALRFSLVFATGTVARMGSNTLAAHEIAFQLFILCSDVIDGLAVAGQALAAKYLGAHQTDAAYRMGKTLMVCGGAAGCLFAAAFLGAREPIIRFFTTSPEVIIALGGGIFVLLALFQPANGVVFVLDGFLIGAHDTRFLMKAMLIGTLIIFVPMSWLSLQLGWGLTGIWTGISVLMTWRLITTSYRFMYKKWRAATIRR